MALAARRHKLGMLNITTAAVNHSVGGMVGGGVEAQCPTSHVCVCGRIERPLKDPLEEET